MAREAVTDNRTCPTCQHCHLNGMGAGICGCYDCSLLWTDIPREYLAPDRLARLRELEEKAGR